MKLIAMTVKQHLPCRKKTNNAKNPAVIVNIDYQMEKAKQICRRNWANQKLVTSENM